MENDETQTAFMTWTPEMSVGVTVLDEDHKRLIGIINQLHAGITAGHKKDILAAVLDHLADYTRFHFEREEKFFARANYPAAPAHKSEHDGFIARIANLQARFKIAPVAMLDLELMNYLRNWLLIHIQGSDKKYGACLNSSGIF